MNDVVVCVASSYGRRRVSCRPWTAGWLPSVRWGSTLQAAGLTLRQSHTSMLVQSSMSPLRSMARFTRESMFTQMLCTDRVAQETQAIGRCHSNVLLYCCPWICQLLTDLQTYFTAKFSSKFIIKWSLKISLHLKHSATLPCEITGTFVTHSVQ